MAISFEERLEGLYCYFAFMSGYYTTMAFLLITGLHSIIPCIMSTVNR